MVYSITEGENKKNVVAMAKNDSAEAGSASGVMKTNNFHAGHLNTKSTKAVVVGQKAKKDADKEEAQQAVLALKQRDLSSKRAEASKKRIAVNVQQILKDNEKKKATQTDVDARTSGIKTNAFSMNSSRVSATVTTSTKAATKSKIREDIDMQAIMSVYKSPEYKKIVGEFFDISDRETRLILTAVDEDDQDKVIMSLTGKIYNNMIDRVDDIDFGDIPSTKGDITQLPNYKKLVESLGLMSELMDRFKESKDTIDVVKEALANVERRTATWKKGFSLNLELPMVMYNTITLAIIESTGYLISMCVEFIKNPSQDSFNIIVDRSKANKSKEHLLFDNLKKFNDACRNGTVDNTMDYIIKSNTKNFVGFATGTTAVFGVVGIAGLLLVIIPIIRELIFLFYYQRVRISDYFETQADLLEINAYNVQNNNSNFTKEEKKSIASKQMAIATRFRKISDTLAIDAKSAEVKATKEISSSNKKFKADEVMDEVPDSAAAALF